MERKNKLNIIEYLKKECVLVIAVSLAVTSSFVYIPKMEYIDFKTLILLFNLMVVVSAFKRLKVLDYIAGMTDDFFINQYNKYFGNK